MKKLIIVSMLAVTLVGSAIGANSRKVNAQDTMSSLNNLINEYVHDNYYQKDTIININNVAQQELASIFHAGVTILDRTTYYTPSALWMSHGAAGDGKYSYYGSNEAGDVTSGVAEEALVAPENIKVAVKYNTDMPNHPWHSKDEKGMDGYYITLKDIVATEGHGWTFNEGVYSSSSEEVISLCKGFTAPCYLGFNSETQNYVTLDHVEIEEKGENLEIRLYANGENDGIISGSDGLTETPEVFSKATITKSHIMGEECHKVEGGHVNHCTICDAPGAINNHNWNEGDETVIATTNPGTMVYTCVDCGETRQETVQAFYQVGRLVGKTWANYEAFTLYVRRSENAANVRLVSDNTVFTSAGRNSRLEVYVASGDNLVRDNNPNVSRIDITSNKSINVVNYGGRQVETNLKYSVKTTNKTVIDIELPYSLIGCDNDDVFGLTCGLWSEVDRDWAPMFVKNTDRLAEVENLGRYVRVNKDNVTYEAINNSESYNLRFSDHYYARISRINGGINLKVTSRLAFPANHFVRFIVDTDGIPAIGGWALDPKDVSFTIYSDRAYISTGRTSFWDLEFNDGKKFHNGDVTQNVPVYAAGDCWTLSLDITYEELGVNESANLKGLLLAFHGDPIQNYGNYYGHILLGDLAVQSNYFPIN